MENDSSPPINMENLTFRGALTAFPFKAAFCLDRPLPIVLWFPMGWSLMVLPCFSTNCGSSFRL